MTDAGYRCALEVAQDRARWAVAVLATLVEDGRERGWIEGEPLGVATNAAAHAHAISKRLVATEQLPSILPVQWLASKLGLDAIEIDALWLLVAIEHDPVVANLVRAFGTGEAAGLTLQLWRRLVPLTMC